MDRWTFTPQERTAILFLVATLLLGTGMLIVDARRPGGLEDFRLIEQAVDPPAPPVQRAAGERSPLAEGRPAPPPEHAGAPVAINTAGIDRWQSLPGIGPATARAIVEHRRHHGPFASIDGLLAVRGIGPRILARLRPHLRLD